MKKAAVVLALLASFAAGDLVGPTPTASAYDYNQNLITQELKGIRRALETIARNTK